jgi:hypothetical protein
MRTNISRYVLSIFTALVLLAALVVTSADARSSRSLVVEIPFDFHVAGRTLPAGQYVVERRTQSSADGLSLRSVNRDVGVFVLTSTVEAGERQSASRLVFTRYHNSYFLSQLWTSGEASGRELIKTAAERTKERELAKAGEKPERVALLALVRK